MLVQIRRSITASIGALGDLRFTRGFYAYIGSAIGGGTDLLHRVRRHFAQRKRIHWHIDYLLASPSAKPVAALLIPETTRLECTLANALLSEGFEPVPRFGCSDCRCVSHLFYLGSSVQKAKEVLYRIVKRLGYQGWWWTPLSPEKDRYSKRYS